MATGRVIDGKEIADNHNMTNIWQGTSLVAKSQLLDSDSMLLKKPIVY